MLNLIHFEETIKLRSLYFNIFQIYFKKPHFYNSLLAKNKRIFEKKD